MPAKPTYEELLKDLRNGLNHLQDPSYLRHSPLAALFGVANRHDTPSAVRRILTQAIEALEPAPDDTSDSRGWRMYESVHYRYVEQIGQEDVARQLGMSVRQLRREQRAALEALAHQLRERYSSQGPREANLEPAPQADGAHVALHDEVPWLRDMPPETPANLSETIAGVVDLSAPLAAGRGVRLEVALAEPVPCVALDPVPLRQILLCLLGAAMRRATANGQVRVSVRAQAWEVAVQIECPGPNEGSCHTSENEQADVTLAHQLAELCGTKLTIASDEEAFRARLMLPALEQLPVLAVDDNEDTLRLLQRYTAGTRYRLLKVRNPEEALAEAERLHPQVIVLDVMMPRVDGWQVLGQMREHPIVGRIPIIVCTIMAQEELALALGASGFVRKPVTRRNLLAALDEQMRQRERVSR